MSLGLLGPYKCDRLMNGSRVWIYSILACCVCASFLKRDRIAIILCFVWIDVDVCLCVSLHFARMSS